ncbi:MAG: hypothetical protein H8E03_01175 [Pelagibacteraceae bacterium]|nr:hypothetical protein [Pelagibacteraceae bacterium]
MDYIDNNIKIPETVPDSILSPGQILNLIESYSKKYRYLQFDILEVKNVITDTSRLIDTNNVVNRGYYGAVTGRLVTSQYNSPLDGKLIKPFSVRDFELPSINEYVLVFERGQPGGTKQASEYYYINSFTTDRSLNFNISQFGGSGFSNTDELKESKTNSDATDLKSVPLPLYKAGDRFIHGRYGHFIQFTNKKNNPCLRITNDIDTFDQKGLFDSYFNNEGSVIYLDNSPDDTPLDLDIRVGGGTPFPKKLTGNQIVIESDRLIFQSKKEEIFINAAKKLAINAPEIVINGHHFIHGEVLNDTLEELVKEINSISTWAMTMGYIPGEKPPHPALGFLRTLMKNIFNPRHRGSPWESPESNEIIQKDTKKIFEDATSTKSTTTLLKKSLGTITLPLGTVMIKKSTQSIFRKAKVNQSVYAGDIIKTGKKSRIEIKTSDGHKIRIGQQREFNITKSNFIMLIQADETTVDEHREPTAVAAIRG